MEAEKTKNITSNDVIVPLLEEEKVKRVNVPLYESQIAYLVAYGREKGIHNNMTAVIGLVFGDFFKEAGFLSDDFRNSYYILKQYKNEQLSQRFSQGVCETNKTVGNAVKEEIKSESNRAIDGSDRG